MLVFILFAATLFLAYANGANDNFKGVATLFGSGTTSYRQAITWATACTFAGSIASIVVAPQLIKSFSGKGLVPDTIANGIDFHSSIALAAGLTVILATRFGFPISTTHVSVGSIFGVGLIAGTAHVKVFLQILASWVITLPIAAILSGIIYTVIHRQG